MLQLLDAAGEPHALIEQFVHLLSTKEGICRERAAGVLHNLSAEPALIYRIRGGGIIHGLVGVLNCTCIKTCTAAAGALQNFSHDAFSRSIIQSTDTVRLLTDLLQSSDVLCQVRF